MEDPGLFVGNQFIPDMHRLSPLGVYANIELLKGYCELRDWYKAQKNVVLSVTPEELAASGSMNKATEVKKKNILKM